MPDVIIVGGGLAGLALAHSLHARGRDWLLLEARERLGGRVLTVPDARGLPQDLGPAWYWPETQPSITRLVADLGLASVAQADDGQVWLLDDAARPPHPHPVPALHGGARRLVGGLGALIEALAARLPRERLHLRQPVTRVIDAGDHVRLQVGGGASPARHLAARQVVLALPPRLVAEHIGFEPGLPAALQAALAGTPTWMASAAKAVLSLAHAPWRAQGRSGNAWVTHAQAVLAESWDCGTDAAPALAGVLAVPAAQRLPFATAWPLLLESQAAMLWGDAARPTALRLQDWAGEPHTCSTADRHDDGAAAHPVYGHPALQAPAWDGRLWFAGSETATRGGGYLEGALASAARVRRALAPPLDTACTTAASTTS